MNFWASLKKYSFVSISSKEKVGLLIFNSSSIGVEDMGAVSSF